jgi:peroxiredoxin
LSCRSDTRDCRIDTFFPLRRLKRESSVACTIEDSMQLTSRLGKVVKLDGPHTRAAGSGRRDWIIVGLLAVSLGQNLVLSLGILRLSTAKAALTTAEAEPAGPKTGVKVPALDAQRLNGSRENVEFASDKRPTLLYIFTPSCSWCAKNLNNLKAIADAAARSHRVLALSLDPNVDEYIRKTGLTIPIYVNPSEKMFRPYGLGPTPLTVVVGTDGKIIKSWVGAYSGAIKTDVEAYFSVKLPGLVGQLAPSITNE